MQAGPPTTEGQIVSPTSISLSGLIKTVAGIIPVVVIIVLFGMFVYGGFTRMTAAGNAEQEEKSTNILRAAVIGFIIIALSPLLINILGKLLGVQGNLIG